MDKRNPKPETSAEKRHRLMRGKGLCHAHQLLYGGVQVCGKRQIPGGIKLCDDHARVFLEALKPAGDVWINRRTLDQLRRESDAYRSEREQNRPLERRIKELEAEVKELTALPPRARRKQAAQVEHGHIYFLLSDNAVKIGWTSDLDQRMKSYSPGTKILAVMPGARKDETRLHRKFSHLRTNRREWFAYSPQVMEEVERIVREHGDPPRDLNEPMTTARIVGPRLNNYTQRRARSLGK